MQGEPLLYSCTYLASFASSELGVPILGGVFPSQNYLLIDYDRGVFGLAPATVGKMDSSERIVMCPAMTLTSKRHPSAGTIAAIVLGVLLAIIILLGIAKWMISKRKQWKENSGILDTVEEGGANNTLTNPHIQQMQAHHESRISLSTVGDRASL
jgi:hypothetical protein